MGLVPAAPLCSQEGGDVLPCYALVGPIRDRQNNAITKLYIDCQQGPQTCLKIVKQGPKRNVHHPLEP